jgi:hypothetical protein
LTKSGSNLAAARRKALTSLSANSMQMTVGDRPAGRRLVAVRCRQVQVLGCTYMRHRWRPAAQGLVTMAWQGPRGSHLVLTRDTRPSNGS